MSPVPFFSKENCQSQQLGKLFSCEGAFIRHLGKAKEKETSNGFPLKPPLSVFRVLQNPHYNNALTEAFFFFFLYLYKQIKD